MKLSLCIITLNEEKNLGRCLQSAKTVVDEIIIVDSGSTDNTEAIARDYNANWIERKWSGYVKQKNFAIEQASYDWILSLDADEVLSPQLISEIIQWKTNRVQYPGVNGFRFSRCVFYEGRWIRHGDWYPDRLVRLFARGAGEFKGGRVHERLEIAGKVVDLQGELEHFSFESEEDHKSRIRKYAKLWAESKSEQGKIAWAGEGEFRAIFRFFRGYLLRMGFMDGKQGFKIAWLCSAEVLLKYKTLMHIKNSNNG